MLNFKDWKLASADGNTATLRHAKGHEMTIAVKSLPKIQREQILRLAKVQQFKDGSTDETGSPDTVQTDNSGGDAGTTQPPPAAGGTHITINAAPAQQPAPAVQPAQNPAASYGAEPVNVVAPTVPGAGKNLNPNTGTMNPAAVAGNAQEAVRGQQAIDTAKTTAAVPVEKGYLEGVQKNQENAQAIYNQMQQHVEDFGQFVKNNPVNPNAYLENMGAGKKVLSGLGLILGGVGAGQLGSTDNPALRFLNNQIDRDIAGQQARVNNQRTVLGAYRDLYGDGVAANNLTKASLLDIYAHKAQLIADKLGTPQARVTAQALGAATAIEKSKLLQDAAVDLANLPGTSPTSVDVGANASKAPPPEPGGMTTQELQAMHDQQGNAPVQAGLPSSGSEGPQKPNPLDTAGDNNQVLHPDAEHRLNALRYGAPRDRQDFETARAQYDQAFNADQQLKQVNGLYKRLYGETNGLWGRMHRGINPHAIAAGAGALGTAGGMIAGGPAGAVAGGTALGALGEGVGHGLQAVTNTGANQEYDRDLEALKGIISSSLKNRGDMTVEEAVQKFAPTDRDTPEQAMKKREAFKEFITSHIDKGIITLHGIAHRSR